MEKQEVDRKPGAAEAEKEKTPDKPEETPATAPTEPEKTPAPAPTQPEDDDEDGEDEPADPAQKRRRRRLIAILIVLDLLLIAVGGWVFTRLQKEQTVQEESRLTHLEQINAAMQHVLYEPEAVMTQDRIAIMLSNGEESGCSIRVQLVLLNTHEILAETALIDPGYRLEKLQANRTLEPGSHPCLLRIELFTAEEGSLGTVGRSLLLNVQ